MERQQPAKGGYVTLLATLIVSVFGVALATSFLYLGGSSAESARILEQSFEARGFADACAEQALLTIEQQEAFEGSGSLTFEQGSCTFEVSQSDEESTVESTGGSGEVVRKVKVVATVELVAGEFGTTTLITSSNWSEPADF